LINAPCFEIAALQNHRTRILIRLDSQALFFVIDGDLLLLHRDRQGEF